MPARRKTLEELVASRSFLARRHGDRLLEAPPLKRADLRTLQEAYRAAELDRVRQAIARAFEAAQKASPTRELAEVVGIARPDAGVAELRGRERTQTLARHERLRALTRRPPPAPPDPAPDPTVRRLERSLRTAQVGRDSWRARAKAAEAREPKKPKAAAKRKPRGDGARTQA